MWRQTEHDSKRNFSRLTRSSTVREDLVRMFLVDYEKKVSLIITINLNIHDLFRGKNKLFCNIIVRQPKMPQIAFLHRVDISLSALSVVFIEL